jgi:hypothetical protein
VVQERAAGSSDPTCRRGFSLCGKQSDVRRRRQFKGMTIRKLYYSREGVISCRAVLNIAPSRSNAIIFCITIAQDTFY